MFKRLLTIGVAAASISVGGFWCAGAASAEPVCGTPGTPPCAPSLSPEQQCALIAWRTWTPCNWVGVQVPIGTPGSVA